MKRKVLILSLLSAFFAGSIHAQLKVNSNGSVNLAATDNQTNKVSVGTPNYMSGTSTGLYSELTTLGGALNSAVVGNIQISGSATGKCAVGVCGSAYGGQLGLNYGIVGSAVVNGAGVYGTTGLTASVIPGTYAGYFNGTTYVNGQTYTQSLLIPSDIRLKTNVASFSDSETAGSALDNVLAMNVLKYNYAKREEEKGFSLFASDEQREAAEKMEAGRKAALSGELHFGVSAQELQTIYPNLVVEGQDGYLAVNYVELVPVLIRSIQELSTKVAELEGKGSAVKAKAMTAADIENATASSSVLFQNSPNPFKERTEIRFTIADGAKDACICIFDMQGKMLKRVAVSPTDTSIAIGSGELKAGMYLYTLIVDGQEIATRRMILNN